MTRCATILLAAALSCVLCTATSADEEPTERRAGLIGLDTSHVIAFTRLFNDPEAEGELAHVRVVAGYPGGTDIPASRDRVEGFTDRLREQGIEIVQTIGELLERVDVVLLTSVDGRVHLEQAIPVLEAGKPLFIDKPLAGSLADAVAIARLADAHGVGWFSSSALRFSPGILGMRGGDEQIGEVVGCDAWGPSAIEPSHPDLFWYGIHGVEILYTIMGPGCESVVRVKTEGTEKVVGTWADGRIGSFRGIREGQGGFGATVFGTEGIAPAGSFEGYGPMLEPMARFFRTGEVPIDPAETLELFAFMEAADESKRRGGVPVDLAEVMERAEAEAEQRVAALQP